MEARLESVIRDLYGTSIDQFVSRRDALARDLRSAGDRDAASAVKSLRKPSRTAWALNRVVHQGSASLSALEAAVAAMIDAHSGAGDPRAAHAELRSAARDFAISAAEEGHRAGFNLDVADLANILLGVIGNPGAYDELRSGRLTEIPEAGGLDFLTLLPSRPKLAVSEARRPPTAEPDPAATAALQEHARLAATALETARRRAEAAATALSTAESEREVAQERVRLAEAELTEAEQRLQFARLGNESAVAELARADAASREANNRLTDIVK